jgi:gliding motility-associated protein GldM
MAHPKETPRQKMIGMMYLVLMALLALNVSRDVIDAFVLVDESLTKTTENFYHKNDVYYQEFDRAAAENPVKAGPWKAKADEVKRKSNELHKYIQGLKLEIVKAAEGDDTEAVEGDNILDEEIKQRENLFVSNEILVGSNKDGKANDLRSALEQYRADLLNLVDEDAVDVRETILSSLNTDDPPPKEGEILRWQDAHFEDVPLIAAVTMLSKMQSDVRNAESDALRYLFSQIEAGSFNFNLVDPVVISPSNYIVRGSEYRANVFMAAFDTTQEPIVYVGEYDSTISDDGIIEYQMKGELGRDYVATPIKGGKGVYSVTTSSLGWKKWGGIISLKRLDGGVTSKPFHAEYQVAEPSLVVSATKMNVFYLGVPNPVEISVPGVPADRIIASSNNGRISPSRGAYVVNPTREGSCQISVSVREDGGTRSRGSKPFRVRKVPDPYATMAGGRSGATLSKSQILAELGPKATMPDWFEFDLEFTVTSFSIATYIQGFYQEIAATSGTFSSAQRDVLRNLNPGAKLYLNDVMAVGPDGSTRNLGTILIKVK